MGKVGQQQHGYCLLFGPRTGTAMDRYITRPQSSALSSPADPFATMDPLLGVEEAGNTAPAISQVPTANPAPAQTTLTPDPRHTKGEVAELTPSNHPHHSCGGGQDLIGTKGRNRPNKRMYRRLRKQIR